MNKTWLLRLADKLEGKGDYANVGPVPEENFDIGSWSCGTTACAIGHAMFDPWFNERGFVPAYGHGYPSHQPPAYLDPDSSHGWRSLSFAAVSSAFGLTEGQVTYLFMREGYKRVKGEITAKHVASRIRAFVAKTEAEAQ